MPSVDAVRVVDAEVRELIRQDGLDPAAAPGAVRDLVAQAVARYAERSVGGELPALPDHADAVASIVAGIAGYGPLQRFFDDPNVEEIWINDPGRVFIARRGRSELTTTVLAEQQVMDLVERMLRSSGRRVDRCEPFVDAALPTAAGCTW